MQFDLPRDRLLELLRRDGHDVHAGVAQLGRDLGAPEDGVDLAVDLFESAAWASWRGRAGRSR